MGLCSMNKDSVSVSEREHVCVFYVCSSVCMCGCVDVWIALERGDVCVWGCVVCVCILCVSLCV